MPVQVDTCGWIEWFVDGELADTFGAFLQDAPGVIVPTAVQFELYKWVKRERDESTALEVVALTEQCQVVPFNTSIALRAADSALAYGLSFADALIYATARQCHATLATADNHFDGLPGVSFFPKTAT